MFLSFSHSFVLSITKGVSCAGDFPLSSGVHITTHSVMTIHTVNISRVNRRQAGVAEGLARCQGEEAENSGTGEGRG